MNIRFIGSLAVGSVLALLVGCDVETTGQKGVMDFSYQSSQCSLVGCGLDNPTLQGARITIQAQGGDPNVPLTAKLAKGNVGSIARQSMSYSCDASTSDPSSSRAIDAGESCNAGETKHSLLDIEIETTNAGGDTLEVHEPSGALRDSVGFLVRAASRIDVKLSDDTHDLVAANGAYTVHIGEKLRLQSEVYDSAGERLMFSEHGLSFAYADKTLLAPDPDILNDIFGATDTEYMAPLDVGDTQVVGTATGATSTTKLHILP